MTDWPILTTVTFLPLVGVVLLLLMNGESASGRKNVLWISLITTVFTFVVSLFIWIGFDNANPGFQMVEKHAFDSLPDADGDRGERPQSNRCNGRAFIQPKKQKANDAVYDRRYGESDQYPCLAG